ncbi:hypothetical protein LCGC14_1102780 [marine sediment metagenome]|uniref:Uncharacterized protein n=1 Tax=marine sediment metagenome TaxID=412755 RepID=A0A0F9QF89_9ZZZZ
MLTDAMAGATLIAALALMVVTARHAVPPRPGLLVIQGAVAVFEVYILLT